jgi:hypothetical protein
MPAGFPIGKVIPANIAFITGIDGFYHFPLGKVAMFPQ